MQSRPATPRRSRAHARDDDWVPPPWNPPVAEPAAKPVRDRNGWIHEQEPARRPVVETKRPTNPAESGYILGLAFAPAIVGFLALLVSFIPLLSGTGNVPRGLLLIIVVQVLAIGALHLGEERPFVESWISTLICTAVLVPLVALQVALLREPYVSLERSSAAPAIVATVVVAMVLFVGATWAIWTSWQNPDEAGLLFMPQAMIVPGLMSMRSTINQRPALEVLAEVMLLAAVAIAISWLLPPAHRMLAPAVAVAVLFVLLWATGNGPWFHATSGGIVRILYGVMLSVIVVLVVCVPLLALWIHNGAKQRGAAVVRSAPVPQSPQLRRTASSRAGGRTSR